MTSALTPDPEVVDVQLLGLPLRLHADAQQHSDELMREFAHIAHSGPDTTERIPNRLLDLVNRARAQYGPFTGPAAEQMDAARASGADSIDLTYRIPPAAADVARQLSDQLDEADEFCRNGDLLTLATPSELVRYRHWFLEEFERQVAGQPPIPWDEYRAR